MSNDNLLELQGSLLHKKKILFINHEQTLTGAPRVLKDIISLLSLNDAYELAVVSLKEGNAPWTQPFHRNWSQVPGDTDEAKAMFLSHEINPDLVFANTIESVPVAILFKEIPKIAYIHERDHLIKRAEKIPLSLLQQFADVWVVCDDAQKLLAAHGVFAHRVEYALDISGEDFLNHARGNYFVSVGTICARKGIDRFLEIASRMPEYSFVWVGDISTSKIIDNVIILKNGSTYPIPTNVQCIGAVPQAEVVRHWVPGARALLMLSYDDPFPIVVSEAKILNQRVVVLKNSGDAYKVCDKGDLVLDNYHPELIVDYLKKASPAPTEINHELIERFKKNINPIIDGIDSVLVVKLVSSTRARLARRGIDK